MLPVADFNLSNVVKKVDSAEPIYFTDQNDKRR